MEHKDYKINTVSTDFLKQCKNIITAQNVFKRKESPSELLPSDAAVPQRAAGLIGPVILAAPLQFASVFAADR